MLNKNLMAGMTDSSIAIITITIVGHPEFEIYQGETILISSPTEDGTKTFFVDPTLAITVTAPMLPKVVADFGCTVTHTIRYYWEVVLTAKKASITISA